MAVLLPERPQTAGGKTRKTPNLPKTSAVVALFAFSSRLDRDTMSLFAKTHSDEVRAAAIAATGQEVLELLHGGLRPNVLVLDALLTKPGVTEVLQEIGTMQLDPEPAVLVLVPVPEETAARKAALAVHAVQDHIRASLLHRVLLPICRVKITAVFGNLSIPSGNHIEKRLWLFTAIFHCNTAVFSERHFKVAVEPAPRRDEHRS